MRAFFQCQPERKHRCQPEKNRQRINRHQERTDIEDRRGIQRDDRRERCGGIEQAPREIKQEHTRSCCEQRTEKADAELIGAENRGAGTHHKRNDRPFAEICRGQPLRPHPVMRLVKFQISRSQQ